MKVLITGGTGFIGFRLALKCLEKGDVVHVLGQENNTAESENRRLIEGQGVKVTLGSVTDKEALFELLQETDLVYHLAATQHEANVPDQRFWDVNVSGTKNILEAAVNAKVKRFMYGSTIGVYGPGDNGVITENSPLMPSDIYGKTKLEAERLVLSYRDRLPAVIIRISETYGPGDRRLLKLFKAVKKKLFFVIGDGQNVHHLIYIDDLIDGLFLALSAPQAIGKTFVLAGHEPITTNQMVAVIAEKLGTRISNLHLPFPPLLMAATITEKILSPLGIQPPLHRRRMDFFKKSFTFSGEHAEKVLGFVPKTAFEEGVGETAKWYSEMSYL
jgi:nucleoside-diphosphate-sugar epimerase